jgi:8-oxo-dGTP diphosphatase
MPVDRHLVCFAVYLLLEREGHVALMRRSHTGWQDGRYSLIAGHVDPGESALTAAVREAEEEAAVIIAPEDLTLVHTMHRNDEVTYVDLYFAASSWAGDPRVMEPNKADDLAWFPLTSLPEDIVPAVEQALTCISAGVAYSDLGW